MALLKTGGWLLALLAASALLTFGQVLAADWLGRWSARPRAASAAPAGESLFEPQVVAEFVGRFPAPQVSYDPAQPGRLYAGGQVSEDAGQSWRELVDPQGRRLVLLGGLRARAPVVGPGGHVLYAEVLFDEPGVPLGLGRLAHVVEWRNGGFEELLAWRRGLLDGPGAERAWPVARSFGYLPEGIPWVAQDETLASLPGSQREPPGPLTAAVVTSTGWVYAAVAGAARFGLYFAGDLGQPWLPVPEVRGIVALAEGPGGGACAVMQGRLGCGVGERWTWSSLPENPAPEQIASGFRGARLAVWGGGRLALRKSPDEKALACPLGDITVAWAAWDPFDDQSLTVVDPAGNAYRVRLDSVR